MRDWRIKMGAFFGALLLIFLMILVICEVLGYPVPCGARMPLVLAFSLGAALATSFIGGSASVRGRLPGLKLKNFAEQKPNTFSAAGGIAVFIIVFSIVYPAYGRAGCNVHGPDGVSYNIPGPTKLSSAIALVAKGAGRDERILGCPDEVLTRMVRPGPVEGPTHAEVIRLLGVRLEGADTVKLQVTTQEGGIYEIRCV
jgi:hypothetical protein